MDLRPLPAWQWVLLSTFRVAAWLQRASQGFFLMALPSSKPDLSGVPEGFHSIGSTTMWCRARWPSVWRPWMVNASSDNCCLFLVSGSEARPFQDTVPMSQGSTWVAATCSAYLLSRSWQSVTFFSFELSLL